MQKRSDVLDVGILIISYFGFNKHLLLMVYGNGITHIQVMVYLCILRIILYYPLESVDLSLRLPERMLKNIFHKILVYLKLLINSKFCFLSFYQNFLILLNNFIENKIKVTLYIIRPSTYFHFIF